MLLVVELILTKFRFAAQLIVLSFYTECHEKFDGIFSPANIRLQTDGRGLHARNFSFIKNA